MKDCRISGVILLHYHCLARTATSIFAADIFIDYRQMAFTWLSACGRTANNELFFVVL